MASNHQAKMIIAAQENGKREGRREVRKEVLDFLEQEYMKPEVKRGTPRAEGILELVTALATLMTVD